MPSPKRTVQHRENHTIPVHHHLNQSENADRISPAIRHSRRPSIATTRLVYNRCDVCKQTKSVTTSLNFSKDDEFICSLECASRQM